MSAAQSILIVGETSAKLSDIAKGILKVQELPPAIEIEKDTFSYPWEVDTKYYTASVNLCCTDVKSLANKSFADTVQAIIIHFDSSDENAMTNVDEWLSFLKEYEADVKILLCDQCQSEPNVGISKLTAQEWCIGKGFELVELSPVLDEDEDEDGDFAESTGVTRIIQALHAHVWPEMTMKSESSWNASRHQTLTQNDSVPSNLAADLESLNIDTPFAPNGPEIEDKIEELFSEGSQELEFSELFSELQSMKERVANLPSEERKACAEKVVMAFWKAIGGDDDEINCDDEEG
ncbi:alpha- and gamma-adaptin-binding protein p34 [Bemisia tabaci]|uniref:alpha- and gamma-adaptin-binding protein p34 n=1 Tax=Bemisia tabaci TaxID=7038 RepID=UPI0008F9887A|nr:PREDICTED: alpha- and gamma-adaptin-binding protein p34-like [Bemisia tabaci]XP_018914703.1 PREDICTED: alpha- and gamma-adaptin-binding protein p34-like [Bemisia tabaci]XP_018914704.1 PREDICTED: alpha- and gamma-adaptin-binding protein p34-like [Bemisia tabaci]